jgi:hypothetical protein
MRQRKTIRRVTVTLCLACLMLGLVACAGTSATESPTLTAGVTALPTAIPVSPTDTVAPASPTVQEQTAQGTSTPVAPTQEAVPTRADVEEREKPTAVPTVRPSETVPTGSEADRMVAAARADLAARLGLSVEEINVQSVEPVEWPDTSLGCPQPGMMYAQVITPGHQILLQARGEMYDYRSAGGRLLVLCEQD